MEGSMEKAVILSLDAEDGSVRWKGERGKSRVGHVTPILVDNDSQLISAGGDRVQASIQTAVNEFGQSTARAKV